MTMPSDTDSTPSSSLERTAQELDTVADILSLPERVPSVGLEIYKQSYENELYHGRRFEAMLGAIVYLAGRTTGVARQPEQVAEAVDSNTDDVLDASRHLIKRLDIPAEPLEPHPYIEQFCEELPVGEETEEVALEIADLSVDEGLHSGRSPSGYAAGSVYAATLVTGADLTQDDIAEVAEVSNVTIRNCYRDQLELYEGRDA